MTTEYGKLERCIMGELYPKGNFKTGGKSLLSKRYNTPHRTHIIKTRVTEEEHADFMERLTAYGMSQSECIPSGNDIDKAIETQEIARTIDLFLDKLPAIEQKVFICRYWYFDNISAISEQFGFSESKIKSMLHRTRKKLRTKLLEEGVLNEE